MSSRPFRVPSAGRPLLDILSRGRVGPGAPGKFSVGQIEQIRRTVGRAPEVMVKVTGGGRKVRAVAAHISYLSHDGTVELETDDGQRVSRASQNDLLMDWHLDLSAGQYRPPPRGSKAAPDRGIKLVHNIVLSMPAPTPADKVLAAAKVFARDKFALKHRYAMALHTHQKHPHVHLVVKAESEDGRERLHIDKARLREWRQDFARMMRDQGVAANATPRAVRGQSRGTEREARYRTHRRGSSYTLREEVQSIIRELSRTGTIHDPAHARLVETRKGVVAGWLGVAACLDRQGEIALAGDVRNFAKNMPPVLTDRERLAAQFIRHMKAQKSARTESDERTRERAAERTR